MTRIFELARVTYNAYREAGGGVDDNGVPLPAWEQMSEQSQECWCNAATAVTEAYKFIQ